MIIALSVLSHREELSEQGRLTNELGNTLYRGSGSHEQAELNSEMADTGVNVGTNADNVNIHEGNTKNPEPMSTALIPPVNVEELGSSALVADERAFS